MTASIDWNDEDDEEGPPPAETDDGHAAYMDLLILACKVPLRDRNLAIVNLVRAYGEARGRYDVAIHHKAGQERLDYLSAQAAAAFELIAERLHAAGLQ